MNYDDHSSTKALTFRELFEERDNPSSKKPAKKAARKKAPARKAARKAAKKAAKKPAKKAARGASCATRRCPVQGERFHTRTRGTFTGIWDRGAGDAGHSRGRYVKQGGSCGTQFGEATELTLGLMQFSETPEAQKVQRGPYEIFLDRAGRWVVYDRRSATILGSTFKTMALAAAYIARGSANRASCHPADPDLRRRSNPSHDEDFLEGEVLPRRDNLGRGAGGSLETRVADLQDRVGGLEERMVTVEEAATESILAIRALRTLSGQEPIRGALGGGRRHRGRDLD